MRTYLITIDPAAPNRHRAFQAIMQLGEAWARPLETTWYVQAGERPEALERRLGGALDPGTGFLIQQVDTAAVLRNTAVHWFRKRRTAQAPQDNVIAFPGAQGIAEAA
jgi:hypothetical protein